MVYSWIQRATDNRALQRWFYRSTLVFFVVFFVGFCAVIPIDSISQASQSSNYALNTFVVVGALVAFGITGIVISVTRIYMRRSALQDIPKYYIPLDEGDVPLSCHRMLVDNFKKCEAIRDLGSKTPASLKHPGLSSPLSEFLPPLLPFDDVIRGMGDKLKYTHTTFTIDVKIPSNYNFRESIAFLESEGIASNSKLNKEYVELYEFMRFSNTLINEDHFIKFMELSIEFAKISRHNIDQLNPALKRNNLTNSQSSLNGESIASSNEDPGFEDDIQPFDETIEPKQTQLEYDLYHNLLKTNSTSHSVYRNG